MPSDEPREFVLEDTEEWAPVEQQEPASAPAREPDKDRAFESRRSLPPSWVAMDEESQSDSDDDSGGYPTILRDDPNLCLRNGGLRLPPLLGLVPDGTTRTDHYNVASSPVSARANPEPPIIETAHNGQYTHGPDAAQSDITFAPGATDGPALYWMPPQVGPPVTVTSTRLVASSSAAKSQRRGTLAFVTKSRRIGSPEVMSFPCKHCDLYFTSLFECSKHVRVKHKDVDLPPKDKKRLPRCVPQYEGTRVIRLSADGSKVTEYLCAHCDRTFAARIPLKLHVKCDHGRV